MQVDTAFEERYPKRPAELQGEVQSDVMLLSDMHRLVPITSQMHWCISVLLGGLPANTCLSLIVLGTCCQLR